MHGSHDAEGADGAFVFEGNWKDFARIAFPNLLLTIVTLGIYRFWATARERRYLWSRTKFVDEHLEWAGTGMELFLGFVMVFVLFGVPYFGLTFIAQAPVFALCDTASRAAAGAASVAGATMAALFSACPICGRTSSAGSLSGCWCPGR